MKGNHNESLISAISDCVVNDIDFLRIQCQGDNFLLGFFCIIPNKIVYLQGEINKDSVMRLKEVLADNGPIVWEPDVYKDTRGYFFESFNSKVLKDIKELTGFHINFVQDNESRSSAGVFRGFHFQLPPYEQAKLVRVVQGAVVDTVIDLRKDSPYYTKIYKNKPRMPRNL